MIKGSIPEFFPKVERGDSSPRSKSKEADASELLSSSSASSSAKSSKSEAPAFKDALRDARAERSDKRRQENQDRADARAGYNSKGEVSDGSQPQDSSKLEDKVSRRAIDSNAKKELKPKVKSDDFVMPGMLPSKFSTPKRELAIDGMDSELISEVSSQGSLLSQEGALEFVEQMQEQFGISAEQIVAAFSQLSPQVLAAPVSESTQAFVNELPLNADQKPQVAALYSAMLEQAGDQVFSEQMTGNQQTAVGTQVIGQKEYNQQVLDQSLRELNQKFFQNGKIESSTDGKVAIAGMTAASGTLAAQAANSSASAPVTANAMSSISSSGITKGNTSPVAEKSSDASASATAGFFSGMTAAISGGNGSAASAEGGSNFSQQQQQQQSQSNVADLKSQLPITAAGAFSPEIAKSKVSAMSGDAKETKALKGDELLNAVSGTMGHGLTSTKLSDAATLGAGAMLPGAVQPNAEDKTVNIQNLIKQAQVIIKEGGGEMKLEMSPEGMGQVNLKVAVENGQVNIQMITQNKEAKKMIEEGLSELKASLAAHKLQVDNLKVDLSEGVSKQMQEQLNDHKQNQSREFAQNFLGNMRDERQGFRQGFFDNSGHKAYKNHAEREGGVPQPNSVGSTSAAKKKQTDRRLDMVA